MKIPALRVEVNGELIAIAGAEDLSILTGQVGFGAGKNQAINTSQVMFKQQGTDHGFELHSSTQHFELSPCPAALA